MSEEKRGEALAGGIIGTIGGATLLLTYQKHLAEFQLSYLVFGVIILGCGFGSLVCFFLSGGEEDIGKTKDR